MAYKALFQPLEMLVNGEWRLRPRNHDQRDVRSIPTSTTPYVLMLELWLY